MWFGQAISAILCYFCIKYMPLASARSQITEAKMAKIEMTYLKENLQLDKQKFALLAGQ